MRCSRYSIPMSSSAPTPPPWRRALRGKTQGAPVIEPEVRGAAAVAQTFVGRAQAALPALIDGMPGLVWAPGGVTRVAFILGTAGEKIVAIDLIADPDHLDRLDVALVEE